MPNLKMLEAQYRQAVTAVVCRQLEVKRANPEDVVYILADLVDARSARDAAAEALYGSPVVRQGRRA